MNEEKFNFCLDRNSSRALGNAGMQGLELVLKKITLNRLRGEGGTGEAGNKWGTTARVQKRKEEEVKRGGDNFKLQLAPIALTMEFLKSNSSFYESK